MVEKDLYDLRGSSDHKDDIPTLVDHFLRTFDRGGCLDELSSDALEALMVYDWPRNVRELRNVIA